MPEPISEQIASEVETRLGNISTAGGYETTASAVVRPTRIEDSSPDDFKLTIKQGQKTKNEDFSRPGNPPIQAWNLPFEITGEIRSSDLDTVSVDTYRNRFEADVQKALATPVASWHTFGGLSFNAEFSEVENVEGENPAFTMTLTVMYRTPENDPYTAA